jgi:hypothetical protein
MIADDCMMAMIPICAVGGGEMAEALVPDILKLLVSSFLSHQYLWNIFSAGCMH